MIFDGIKLNCGVQSFLIIGQSNMAGRGEISDVAPIHNPACHVLRMGRWQLMTEPINHDRSIFSGQPKSGICLAASFADDAQKATGQKIGIIPCADGGTAIDQWMPGEILYDHALMMTKLAMRSSHLAGILWHQGESDCVNEGLARAHKQKFIKMITSLRRDLGDENIPVIIGELCENISERYASPECLKIVNEQYREVVSEIPACAFVPCEGLTLKPDILHFDAVALREFGHRYFKTYAELCNIK
jgi:hypothetical protein